MFRTRSGTQKIVAVYALGLITGVTFITLLNYWLDFQKVQTTEYDKRLEPQQFIRPLIDCASRKPELKTLETPLGFFQKELNNFLKENIKLGRILQADIFFQDLTSGVSFSAGDIIELRPGSLLKIPLVMAYYKKSETDPTILQTKILFDQKDSLRLYEIQDIKPLQTLTLGQSYTIEELMSRAIMYSDNVAASLLEHYDNHEGLKRIAIDLDTPVHKDTPPLREPRINDYAKYFRILFNATYLNEKNSTDFLKLLSKTQFKQGLVAGLPENVLISHKFGESVSPEAPEIHFLNDCGLIYKTSKPYVLCVSIKAKEEPQMAAMIAKISSLFYQKLDEIY